MEITVDASVQVPHPPRRVYDFAVACDNLARFLGPLGPVPGVTAIDMLDGALPAAGARRRVSMTDGASLVEDILELTPPARHRYRWTGGPRPPFSLLVRSGEGDWTFSPDTGGTAVRWTYRFVLTTPLVYPFALLAMLAFRRWMQASLERMRTMIGPSGPKA
jgi:uncharacterized protein YndB with AHSA1/START domain